jgi:hypothetical protein
VKEVIKARKVVEKLFRIVLSEVSGYPVISWRSTCKTIRTLPYSTEVPNFIISFPYAIFRFWCYATSLYKYTLLPHLCETFE